MILLLFPVYSAGAGGPGGLGSGHGGAPQHLRQAAGRVALDRDKLGIIYRANENIHKASPGSAECGAGGC